MFNFDGMFAGAQASSGSNRKQKCTTVKQKVGNMVTSYTQCS